MDKSELRRRLIEAGFDKIPADAENDPPIDDPDNPEADIARMVPVEALSPEMQVVIFSAFPKTKLRGRRRRRRRSRSRSG